MDDLKSKGISAFIWDFFGKLSTQGMGFIVTIFLARLLDPSDFGLIAMIMVVIGIAQVFTDIGLGGALIQRKKVLPIHYSSVFYFNISIACILTAITYFSAEFIATFYNNEELIPLTQVISILFIISALSSVQAIRLRKQLNYALLTKVRFISSMLSGIVGVTLAFYGVGVWSLVAQVISQGIFYNVMLWKVTVWFPSLNFSFKALKQLWGFGFRMFLSGLLDAIFTRMDFLIIGKVFPAATLGYFQRAKSFNSLVIQYSSGSLMAVMFPVLSKVKNDLPRFQNIILKSLNILCLVVFLLLGGLYLTAEELIVFLFSEKWLPSVKYMELLILSGFSYPISALLVNVLSSRGNSKAFLKLEIIKKLFHSVNFVNAYYYGIESYLIGLIVVAVLGVSANILFAGKEINLNSSSFIKPIVTQMIVSILAVTLTLQLIELVTVGMLVGFILKAVAFLFFVFLVNFLINTKSYIEIRELILSFLNRKKYH